MHWVWVTVRESEKIPTLELERSDLRLFPLLLFERTRKVDIGTICRLSSQHSAQVRVGWWTRAIRKDTPLIRMSWNVERIPVSSDPRC